MITSVGGRIGAFGVGAYCATKFAQEGFGESLAQEVAPFGIQVVLVEPGIIRTEAWSVNRIVGAQAADPASPYAEWFARSEAMADRLVRSSSTSAADVAAAVHAAIAADRPKLRYLVGRRARLVVACRRYVPGEAFDRVYFGETVRRITGERPWRRRLPRPLDTRVVLVTGASGRLGQVIVSRLAARGCRVYAGVRDLRTSAAVERLGPGVRAVRMDVTDTDSIGAAISTIVAQAGRLDALVNNAGLYLRGFFEDLREADIRSVFDVNVFGTMAVTRAALPHLRAADGGRLITISSVAGRSGSLITSSYCASKFALEGWGESLAMELAPWGIDAVLVQPAILRANDWSTDRGTAPGALDPASPYYGWFGRARDLMDRVARSSPTDGADVAKTVERALTAWPPRFRYLVGGRARVIFALRRYVPGELVQRLFAAEVIRRVTRPSGVVGASSASR
jgi:NAD(P)-dependent dehydrogenase (short-subunit alcohol dehydrogenase family)